MQLRSRLFSQLAAPTALSTLLLLPCSACFWRSLRSSATQNGTCSKDWTDQQVPLGRPSELWHTVPLNFGNNTYQVTTYASPRTFERSGCKLHRLSACVSIPAVDVDRSSVRCTGGNQTTWPPAGGPCGSYWTAAPARAPLPIAAARRRTTRHVSRGAMQKIGQRTSTLHRRYVDWQRGDQ